MVHYNSWYDFYSYQDEGFNGGFKDPMPDKALIESLRPDILNETLCIQRVDAFGTELVKNRGVKVDSFLWDDGWDDFDSLWEFDKNKFPRRFDVVSGRAKNYSAGTGVWLSPWGGYGFHQERRVQFGKAHGYETNYNARVESEAFSLAGPKYRNAFQEVALNFRREQGVNMFKFDGVAGDPSELADEMEAMLHLITGLRTATRTGQADRPGGGNSKEVTAHKEEDEDNEIWINLTTGTWASPFFLLWADSIWRGGPDIASRQRDWEPDRTRFGQLRSDGLSRRQRWIRWRNLITFVLVVSRSHFFPLSQLMIHGVVLASHGDALHWGLDKFDEIDFTQEVWSFVALGLQLQELYVAPRYMTSRAWDILAEGLRWARREAEVLRDSHWAFGNPMLREAYCTASWSVRDARGFVMLHNPRGVAVLSSKFRLADVLELPSAQADAGLLVWVVKSSFRQEPKDISLAVYGAPKRLVGWGCADLPFLGPETKEPVREAGCNVVPYKVLQIRLLPSEVLVLGATVALQTKSGTKHLEEIGN